MSNATLAAMDRALLAERLAERGEPAYRFDQVWRWTAGGADGYEAMTNVPAALRAELEREVPFSTVGWLPGLRRFVDEVEQPIRLALSLHAPTDELRSELMPVNDRYPLADVLGECRRYVELRRRKVFVEYVMLAGVNDRVEQARALADLLDPKMFKVNLIP